MIFANNKKAYFDYEILEKYEAGLVLSGQEVKSVRHGLMSLRGSYVKIIGNEAWLLGATITPYQPGHTAADYDSRRSRKLLLNRKEIKYFIGKEKGLTLVPLSVYASGNRVKLEIGLARGKKKYDKREVLKKRESSRRIEKIMKRRLI